MRSLKSLSLDSPPSMNSRGKLRPTRQLVRCMTLKIAIRQRLRLEAVTNCTFDTALSIGSAWNASEAAHSVHTSACNAIKAKSDALSPTQSSVLSTPETIGGFIFATCLRGAFRAIIRHPAPLLLQMGVTVVVAVCVDWSQSISSATSRQPDASNALSVFHSVL